MTKSDCTVVFNHFDRIADQAAAAAEDLVERTAQLVAKDIDATWQSRKLPIAVTGAGHTRTVTVGSTEYWYAGFLEFGTRFMASRPALRKSANERRAAFIAAARDLERHLR